MACRAGRSGVAEYCPAHGDQVKGILLRHLHDAVRADIDVPSCGGLDRADPRRRLDADRATHKRAPTRNAGSTTSRTTSPESKRWNESSASRRKPIKRRPVVIQHAVWVYLRFALSYRDVEDLLAERGRPMIWAHRMTFIESAGRVVLGLQIWSRNVGPS